MDKILGENWDLNYGFGGSISFGFLNKPTKIIFSNNFFADFSESFSHSTNEQDIQEWTK